MMKPETEPTQAPQGSAAELLRSLTPEVFQAERSAQRHPRVEARRNQGTPPAAAMSAVADHADRTLPALAQAVEQAGLSVSPGGMAVGSGLSRLRRHLGDLLLSRERSYRATLLGTRHGLDALRALQRAADAAGAAVLSRCCAQVVAERAALIDDLEVQLGWFAEHADQALDPAEPSALGRGLQRVAQALHPRT